MGFTAMKSMKLIMAGGAVAATALLSACSGNSVAANGSASAAGTAPVAAKSAPQGGSGGSAAVTQERDSDGNVNCSVRGGTVGPAGGKQMNLIAMRSTDGSIPGCTEAFTVMSQYYKLVPTKGEGPGKRVLDVAGDWTCALGAGDELAQGVVNCGKGATGLMIKTAPVGAKTVSADPVQRRFPNTTQTVRFTGYDKAAGMAQFQLILWKSGGADDGHFTPVPGDSKTYRLPLSDRDQVFSAATLCSGGDVTVDGDGIGSKACSPQDLMTALTGANPPAAQIHVDQDDRIDVVKELYHP
ncbi:hypothetical protein [Amycolatopsis benzoatilytica]|uniref:hypothetical protein n=1 Tax=Amycolatopsis benzoatilytica TaxID=346045 RepID=UPI00035DB5BA|nr:hypothetical protein [Amycolatopsis benzoatilytica]